MANINIYFVPENVQMNFIKLPSQKSVNNVAKSMKFATHLMIYKNFAVENVMMIIGMNIALLYIRNVHRVIEGLIHIIKIKYIVQKNVQEKHNKTGLIANVNIVENHLRELNQNTTKIKDTTVLRNAKILDNAWSHEDIEKLKKYYGKVSKEEITKIVSDKWDYEAIRRKAQWIGLTQSNLWTQKEIQTLLDTYSKYPVNHILKLLPNKTYASILGQARKQNLLSYFYLTNTYSKEEEQFIRDNYLIMTDEEIGEKLNRTPYAISQRIYKLNLHRPLEKHNYGTLNNYMRAKLTMWKQRYREKCNYTCALSGSHSNIIVHHIYGFNLLMLETIELLNFPLYEDLDLYSQDELDLFVKTFLDLQEYYGEYICITENIHKKFHSIYGYGNNTREQWDEFVNNYYITNQKIS